MPEEISRLLECVLVEHAKRRANLVLQPKLSFHDMLLHKNKNNQNVLYIGEIKNICLNLNINYKNVVLKKPAAAQMFRYSQGPWQYQSGTSKASLFSHDRVLLYEFINSCGWTKF